MKITGIYIIKNKINNLVYVGQSIDIMCRWYAHKRSAQNITDQSHYTKIHQAMKQLGIDNFYMEILEECSYEELSEREIYWISYYNSYNNGYNMTLGGENNKGESNGRAILTQMYVEDIRMAYNNHIPFRDVYEKYKNTISKRGLQKVWHFKTWKHIMPEVYTEENRMWHKTYACGFAQPKINNKSKQFDEQTILKIKQLRKNGLSYDKIAKEVGCSKTTARKYCLYEKNNNPNGGIQIKNIETDLIFNNYTEASKWCQCDRHTIANNVNTNKSAGVVPTTNEPAHWIKL